MSQTVTTETASALVGLVGGETKLVVPDSLGDDAASTSITRSQSLPSAAESDETGGLLYTRAKDRPSLEKLLAEHRVLTAVFERETSLWPAALASGIAVAFAAVGISLLAVNISGTSGPDPLVSAFLVLAGVGLIATVITAIRTR